MCYLCKTDEARAACTTNDRINEVETALREVDVPVVRVPSPISESPHGRLEVHLTEDGLGGEEGGAESALVQVSDGVEMDGEGAGLHVMWEASTRENETLTPCWLCATVDDVEDAAHLVLRLVE